MSQLDVVLPVCGQATYTKGILDNIYHNTTKPDRIIIIDNSPAEDRENEKLARAWAEHLTITLISPPQNIGVNTSWNLGIAKSEASLVSILNNDLVLPTFFFQALIDTFNSTPLAGYVIPTTTDIEKVQAPDTGRRRILDCGCREGWAFTMRRHIPVMAGPIPESMFTFYGDDYLFQITEKQGYRCYKMADVCIHHYLSRTLYSSGGANYLGADQAAWNALGERRLGNPEAAASEWRKIHESLN